MTSAGALVATTRRLPGPVDLIGVGTAPDGVLWTTDEMGLAGEGVVLRLGYRASGGGAEVAHALQGIETRDDLDLPGTGPVAFAALPFDPERRGELVVPRRIVGRRGELWWETTVERRDGVADPTTDPATTDPATTHVTEPAGGISPDEFALTPSMAHGDWMQVIAEAVERIHHGQLDKVVLARRVDVVANRPFLVPEVVSRLVALYPACMIFHVGGFIGASPELLIRREGNRFASHPLAGTVARSGDRVADEALVAGLLASAKDRWEHQIVIEHLTEALTPWSDTLEVPDVPVILGLRNVSHLATPIEGRLAERDGRVPSVLDLVASIHPTAAVGGHPAVEARAYLEKVEGFDRGSYGGPVGWVDARGDGAWAVGIRSARLEGCRAGMYAGVGVVADSDPVAELAETQLKLQALLAALVRP